MQVNPLLGVLFHWIGGLSAASCYLPFRGIRRWSWEVYWFVQGCFSWILAPALLALLLVPETSRILRSAPVTTLAAIFVWGAVWGLGGLLFGLGVRYIGIALGYTIALGVSTVFGTLLPVLFAGQLRVIAGERSGQVTLAGIGVCVLAIAISGWAGHWKERDLAGHVAEVAASPSGQEPFRFGLGGVVAIFAGLFSACFNYGLTVAKPISAQAAHSLLQHGRTDLWQSLPALVILLWGGWATNACWCAFLWWRNRSMSQFFGVHELSPLRIAVNYGFAAAAGLLWYGQFFFYSMGQARMGPFDFASWTLHMAGTILFATLWSVILCEWRGSSRRTRVLGVLGFSTLLASTLIVGAGTYLKGQQGATKAIAERHR